MHSRITAIDPTLMNFPVFYLTPLPGWVLNAEADRTFNSSGSIIKRVVGSNESMNATFQLEFGREFRYNQFEEQMQAQMQQMQAQIAPMGNMFGFNPFGMPQAPAQSFSNLPGMPIYNQTQQSANKLVQTLPSTSLPVSAVDYLQHIYSVQGLNIPNAHDEKIIMLEELMLTRKNEFEALQNSLQQSLQQLNALSFGAQATNQITFDSAQMSVMYEQANRHMIYLSEVLLIYAYITLPFMNGTEISWRQPVLSLYTVPLELLEDVKNQANTICSTYEEEPKYLEHLEQMQKREKEMRDSQARHNNEMARMTQRTNDEINASMQRHLQSQRTSNSNNMDMWTRIISR
jgi:hypothetical protein